MLSYVIPVVLKKPIVVLKDNRDRSTKGRLQKQEQRTTMPCGLYLRIVPTYFLHITKTQRTQRTQRNNDEKSVYQEMPRHFPDRLRDENNGVSPLCRGFTTNGTRHRLLL